MTALPPDLTPEPKDRWNIGRFLILGYATLAFMVVGFGAWGGFTSIAGAIVAHGTIEVQGNRQVVQHAKGGVIEKINVRDGDVVKAGDVLVELAGDDERSEFGIVEGQWFEILARKARLAAERDLTDTIVFSPELVARAAQDPKVAELMVAQQQQFEASAKVRDEELAQLTEREQQIEKQNVGLVAVDKATRSQLDMLSQEIKVQEDLLAKGLTQLARVLALKREFASLEGEGARAEAAIAENGGKIAETAIERVRLVSKMREEAIGELRDLEYREIELRERRAALTLQIEDLQLRAPVSGVVYGSTVDTLRGVIRAAEPIMYIVPQDAGLVVKAKVEPVNIDRVHVGQDARMRFAAFDARTTPEVDGKVLKVSADAIVEQQTQMRYYLAEISITQEARDKLGEVEILPGMPVESYIRTGDRSPLVYLTKPLTDYFAKAFREG
jgi:HlyD family secretion protein